MKISLISNLSFLLYFLSYCSSMKFNFKINPVAMQCLAEYLTTGTLGKKNSKYFQFNFKIYSHFKNIPLSNFHSKCKFPRYQSKII